MEISEISWSRLQPLVAVSGGTFGGVKKKIEVGGWEAVNPDDSQYIYIKILAGRSPAETKPRL